jgi:ATP-dependent protease ClpP protease subunit
MNPIAIPILGIACGMIAIIFGVANDMFKRWLKHKEAMVQVIASQTAEQAAQYGAHVERLEQRVRVLERIVTDRGIAVADEIEKLREAPLN